VSLALRSHFPITEFEAKLQDLLDGTERLYYRLGVNTDLTAQLSERIAQMRAPQSQTDHPPRTIIDPATIVNRDARAEVS